MGHRRRRLISIAVLATLVSSHSWAVTFYASTGGEIWAIEIPTGAGTRIGNTGYPMITDLAAGPGGELYGTTGDTLLRIDIATAAATALGPHGAIPGLMVGLDFSDDGVLYGVTQSAGALVTLDPSNGSAIDIVPISYSSVGDVAVASDCTLYGSFMPGSLVRLSPVIGVLRFIGSTSRMSALDFDPETNLLYGVEGTTNQIVKVDVTTGSLDSSGLGAAPINVFGGTFLQSTGCACSAQPTGPGPLGNTLRLIRFRDDALLSWGSHPEAVEYSIRRDALKGDLGLTELRWETNTSGVDLGAVVAAASPLFYQVLPVDCAGNAGPI